MQIYVTIPLNHKPILQMGMMYRNIRQPANIIGIKSTSTPLFILLLAVKTCRDTSIRYSIHSQAQSYDESF